MASTVGGLLLCHRWGEARAWLEALTVQTPAVTAVSNPIPRRIAWIARLALELVQPSSIDLEWELNELYLLRWLPPSRTEHQVWDAWLEAFLHSVAGELEQDDQRDLGRCRIVLEALLPALSGVRTPQRSDGGLVHRFQLLVQGCQFRAPRAAAQLSLSLQRQSYDWLALMPLLEQSCELDDRALLKLRPELELALDRFSDALLRWPPLLVLQPSESLLHASVRLREQALVLLQQCRRRMAACTQELPCHSRPRRRWLLLASDDLAQCFLYRVEQKRQQLTALGCEVRLVMRDALDDWSWSEQLLWADAVVVCRLPATQQLMRCLDAVHQAGLPTYYDVDDLVVDPEHGVPPLASYGGTITPRQHRRLVLDVPLFAVAMRACDAAIVSTPSLARRWRELNPGQSVLVLPNLAPPELCDALRRPRRLARRPRLVVASGTKAHKQIWIDELAPALAQLLQRNSGLQLDLLGHLQLPLVLHPHISRIRCHPFSDYATYLKRMGQADIGLVALEPGLYTDAKSAIRWMEFSYLGLASVLSPTRTYTEILEDGVHTRFASGVEQWVSAVEQLLADPCNMRAMAQRAQQRAQELFASAQADVFWRPLLEPRPVGESATRGRQRRKVLMLNVFFAPHSIGGATRIVQDQVSALTSRLADDWEVTVLCTDPESWMRPPKSSDQSGPSKPWLYEQPLPVQVHQWNGARVVRLTVPAKDWGHHQEVSVAAFCRRWFAQERFDLVHAHCIQVLGVGPLQVARQRNIPTSLHCMTAGGCFQDNS